VQKLLGHHSPAFTLATYVHLLPDDLPEPTFLDGLDTAEEAVAEALSEVEKLAPTRKVAAVGGAPPGHPSS
jgi:hypothetical protein